MDGNTLGYFLYYHAYKIPYYLLNAVVLGQQKLEEYKVASELDTNASTLVFTTS